MVRSYSNISEIRYEDFKIFYPIKIYYIIDIMPLHLYLLCTMVIGAIMTVPDCNAASGGTGPTQEGPIEHKNQGLTQIDREFLLRLARQSLEACVLGRTIFMPITPPESTKKNQGCFVTLTKSGNLRGCIGYIEGIKPLFEAVIDNAKNAALSDPRFPQVSPDELSVIRIEISVLTPPEPLSYTTPDDLLEKLVPGQDGVILQSGFHQSTYLPQVWEHFGANKVDFLEELSLKGGMQKDGWKTAIVKRYRAIHFQEN